LKSLINSSQNRGSGASSGVVDILIKESVKTVVAGRFGDKMKKQLEANKIEYHEHAGIVKKTVEIFIKNKRSRNVQK
jgi:predicted Fe-Mo cluster-binding NifX family protein